MQTIVISAALAFTLSCAGTRAMLGLLRRGAVLDIPNARSSHVVPTPRGGGLAVVAATLAAALFGATMQGGGSPTIGIISGAAIALSVLSFVDDLRNLSAAIRLGAHAVAVGIGLWALGGHGAFAGFLPQPVDLMLTGLGWLWFVNLYNFMDGIDGIVGSETAAIGVGVAGLVLLGIAPPDLLGMAVSVAAAALGFLVWNWHPARIFLGDAGSVPLGYLVGYLLIATAGSDDGSGTSLAAAALLPLVFAIDATVTLLRRIARREKLTEAHRQHAYQQAVIGGWSHARVCLAIAAVNLALIAVAWTLASWIPWVAAVFGLAIGGLGVHQLRRVRHRTDRP